MINRTDLLITQNCVVHFVDALADVHRSRLQGQLEKMVSRVVDVDLC